MLKIRRLQQINSINRLLLMYNSFGTSFIHSKLGTVFSDPHCILLSIMGPIIEVPQVILTASTGISRYLLCHRKNITVDFITSSYNFFLLKRSLQINETRHTIVFFEKPPKTSRIHQKRLNTSKNVEN